MLIVDTGPLVAAADRSDRHHDQFREVIETDPGPFVTTAMVVAETAYLLDRPVWAAIVGGALGLLYWALEALTMRIGAKMSANVAVSVAVAGSLIRLVVVFSLLVAVALLWRPVFATTLFAFVASFSVYLGVRVASFPLARGPVGTVKAQ